MGPVLTRCTDAEQFYNAALFQSLCAFNDVCASAVETAAEKHLAAITVFVAWLRADSMQAALASVAGTDMVKQVRRVVCYAQLLDCVQMRRLMSHLAAHAHSQLAGVEAPTAAARLPEQIELQGFIPLQHAWPDSDAPVETNEELVRRSRLMAVVAFAQQMQLSEAPETCASGTDSGALRGGSQHTMARLRLAHQVDALQEQAQMQTAESLAPFLVCDTTTAVEHVSLLQTLLHERKCMVVVPLCVVAALDRLKAGVQAVNKSARAATAFLEEVRLANRRRGEL